MTKWKLVLLQGSIVAVCLGLGFWLGTWRSNRFHEQCFFVSEHFEVSSKIKALRCLYQSDSDGAIQELERGLDRAAIVFSPGDNNQRPLKDWDRAILSMIAKHRESHPFLDKKHPGVSQMVQTSLQSLKQQAPNP